MKSVGYMTLACAISLIVVGVSLPEVASEMALGMIAPLVVAIVTMVSIERVYRQTPKRLTALMIRAFGAKMVFFAIYVVAVLTLTASNPVPFVLSFSAYFIFLHGTEALLLRSLFAKATS